MKKRILYIASILLLLSSCRERTKDSSHKKTETYNNVLASKKNLDSLFFSLSKENKFMGSINISQNKKTVYQNTIGFENIVTEKKATSSSLYKIGSISKMYTSALILMAIEEQKLSLNQSIDSFFPDLKKAESITIKNLLNHSSGIPSYTKYSDFLSYHTKATTKEELLLLINQVHKKHYEGPKNAYSNSNYVLLTFILENVYKSDLKTIFSQKIKAPLKLNQTYYIKTKNSNSLLSYKYNLETSSWKALPTTNLSNALGAGGFIASPSDVNKFLNALFSFKIINRESLHQMLEIEKGFGLGIFNFTLNGRKCFGHHGEIDGYSSSAIYFPEDKLAITLTSNASNNNISAILTKALKIYFNDPIMTISLEELEKFAGTYYNPKDSNEKTVFIIEDNKLVHIINDEFKNSLIYKGDRTFLLEQTYAEAMLFHFSENGEKLNIKQGSYNGNAFKK